jgi:hypothetical protein
MTSADVARVLGVSIRQVQRFVESGQIANQRYPPAMTCPITVTPRLHSSAATCATWA